MSRIYQPIVIRRFLLLLLTTACIHTSLSAQLLPEEGQQEVIIHRTVDVRSLSMGSATLSDRMNLSPMGINASLTALRQPDMNVQFNSVHHWDNNQMVSSITLPTLSITSHRVTGRFGLSHKGSDQFNFLKSPSQPLPDLQIYQADIAYAYRFSGAFSMGVLNRFAHIQNDENELVTYSVDVGLVYAPQGKITYGLIARGIGRHGVYGYNTVGDMYLGSSSQEAGVELGATFHYPSESHTIMSISFANEKKLYEDGIWYKGGIEVLPIPMIALRSGLLFHLEQSVSIPRYGLGLNAGMFHLDYMVSPHRRASEQLHQIGVTIEF